MSIVLGRRSRDEAEIDPDVDVHSGSRSVKLVGIEPRVDLLPPEVRAGRKSEALVRRLVSTLVIVVLLVVAAIGGSMFAAMQSQNALAVEQGRTQKLITEQAKYGVVKQVQNQVQLTQAAQQVGASTEIDWNAFLGRVKKTIPGTVVLNGVTIDSASPLAEYVQSTIPLQGTRVATVTLDVTTHSLGDLPGWFAALAKLPGVGDVTPGDLTLGSEGMYSATAILHLNETAFDGRFITKEK